ncbi:MAG: AEC family transporter [Candidatus Nomurabacteria bacterium]|jgi:predicted permease|nr:AEC family transporter [Candidatus Nomurabacteria bacterium]
MDINLADFYARLGTIVLILALGFFLGKIKWINTATNKQLVNLLLMVFMPAALFSAFPSEYSDASLQMFFAGLLGGVVVLFALMIVAKIVFNKWWYKGEVGYQSQFALIFNNATFLGYPIIAHTFGEVGIIPYCGFIIAFNLALFSYGVWLFERKISWRLVKSTLLNPNIIAVLLGMGCFLLNLALPAAIDEAVGFVGSATTPISLICIGFMLSSAKLSKLVKKWRLLITAAIQLILGPTITYFLLSWLQFPQEVIVVCTLIQALPTATSLGLFAAKYGGDEVGASELVTISTLLSIVTLPIMISVLLI